MRAGNFGWLLAVLGLATSGFWVPSADADQPGPDDKSADATEKTDDTKSEKSEKAEKAKKAKKKKAKGTPEQTKATAKLKRLRADRPFWTWLADPNGREIRVILTKVEENRAFARNSAMFSYQGAFMPGSVLERERALNDAIGMLKYARKLSPTNATVLLTLGSVTALAGRSKAAIEAYEAVLALPKKLDDQARTAHSALGKLFAQRHEWDKAAEHLEIGLSGQLGYQYSTNGFVYAQVEMERGNIDHAIDYLVNIPNLDGTFSQLALAVAYDRNDEETKASAILDSMKRTQTLSTVMTPPWGTDTLPFTPAHDLHYFRALLYEASGHLAEARAEWLSYIRADSDARYREKARRHLQDIDALENTRPANTPAPTATLRPGGILGPLPTP